MKALDVTLTVFIKIFIVLSIFTAIYSPEAIGLIYGKIDVAYDQVWVSYLEEDYCGE